MMSINCPLFLDRHIKIVNCPFNKLQWTQLVGRSKPQVATDFGLSGSIFCQVQAVLQVQRHSALRKENQLHMGRPLSSLNAPKLHVYHTGDA